MPQPARPYRLFNSINRTNRVARFCGTRQKEPITFAPLRAPLENGGTFNETIDSIQYTNEA